MEDMTQDDKRQKVTILLIRSGVLNTGGMMKMDTESVK